MNTCMKKKRLSPQLQITYRAVAKSIVKKQQQKSGGSQITCNVGADVNEKNS